MTFETTGNPSVHGDVAFQPLDTLWDNKYFLILVTVIATLISAAVVEQKPPLFSANGSMIFRFSRDYFPSDVAIETWQGEPVRVHINDAIHTEMEILGSRRVLSTTLKSTPEYSAGLPATESLEQLIKALSIRRIEGSYVVRVSLESVDARLAQEFLVQLFETYFLEREVLLSANQSEALGRAALEAALVARESRQLAISYQSGYGLVETDHQMANLLAQRNQLITGTFDDSNQTRIANQQSSTIARLHALDKEISLLGERQAKLAELVIAAEVDEETYRQTQTLANNYRLSAKLDAARGPVIEILDVPIADQKPIGLPPAGQAILGGLLGLLLISVFVLFVDWWKFRKSRSGKSLENLPSPLVDTLKRRQAEAMMAPELADDDA